MVHIRSSSWPTEHLSSTELELSCCSAQDPHRNRVKQQISFSLAQLQSTTGLVPEDKLCSCDASLTANPGDVTNGMMIKVHYSWISTKAQSLFSCQLSDTGQCCWKLIRELVRKLEFYSWTLLWGNRKIFYHFPGGYFTALNVQERTSSHSLTAFQLSYVKRVVLKSLFGDRAVMLWSEINI